jgi:hypothetical protein
MSCNELASQLERSFRTTSALLRRLLEGLTQRRLAWTSARPSTLRPSPELEQLASSLASEEKARGTLLAKIAELLPQAAAVPADELHVNVTRITTAVPAALGRALRNAADEAVALGKRVRSEVTLGARLLRFTQRAHEAMLGQLAAQGPGLDGATGYDRCARSRAGIGVAAPSGRLIDGRV